MAWCCCQHGCTWEAEAATPALSIGRGDGTDAQRAAAAVTNQLDSRLPSFCTFLLAPYRHPITSAAMGNAASAPAASSERVVLAVDDSCEWTRLPHDTGLWVSGWG